MYIQFVSIVHPYLGNYILKFEESFPSLNKAGVQLETENIN